MTRRRLPIGIQTFREMREENHYYVDKTPYIRRMIDEGKHYFLSRPRRFGKSLFLDTLKELFEGNEPLFDGLYIHDHYDWSVRHPVIRLSFGRGNFKEPSYLQANVMEQLTAIESRSGVVAEAATTPGRFASLIEALHDWGGQRVVVLVDEYDKPILDALEVPEVARANRDFLRGLYATIKDSDAHIKFTFLTGVSKFSKVSLFSGLNNLTDITIDPQYSALCGYTEEDLDTVFAPELRGLDRDQIREWYNGYSWRGEEKVYNPFDILLLFRNREFRAYWFQTGTPTFLIEMLVDRGVRANYEGYYASVFYSYFASVGFDIVVEDSSSQGRLDMAVRFNDTVYLFEFKVVELAPEGSAIAQLRQKRYADKYRDLGEPIHLIAVEFSRETRNLVGFETALA